MIYLIVNVCSLLTILSLLFSNMDYRGKIEAFITEIESNTMASSDTYITNILETVKGQIRESLNMTEKGSRENWFGKWGSHYLLSLEDAISSEVCNNFKDKAVQNFGGEYFDNLRDEMNIIFETLPPPKKDVVCTTYSIHASGRSNSSMLSQAPAPAPVNMSVYNCPSGPCCAEGCRLFMFDDTYKKVEDIIKGDLVKTYNHNTHSFTISEIEVVIKTKCIDNSELLVNINGLRVTPYHPIIYWKGFNKKM